MEEVIFANDVVEQHPMFPICSSTLLNISQRDYSDKYWFNPEIECLDVDSYEITQGKSQRDCTVDAVIGIKSHSQNRFIKPRLLLVELRMYYESIKGLSWTKMEDKVKYTRSILSGEVCTIDPCSLFIFNDKIIARVKSWFDRKKKEGGVLRDSDVCSVTNFPKVIHSEKDFPPTYIYSEYEIIESLKPYIKEQFIQEFVEQVKSWCEIASKNRYSNYLEYKHLQTIIKKYWSLFRQTIKISDDNEELEVLVLEEEYDFILVSD